MRIKSLLFIFTLTLLSCRKENLGDCLKSTGKIVEKNREIGDFTKIELNDRINLFITYGNQRSLTVKAGENLQEFIRTKVKGNTLILKNDNRCNWVRSFKKEMDVFLTTPKMKEINYNGSGAIHFLNTFLTDTLIVNFRESSGDLNLAIHTRYLELNIYTGVGSIQGRGIAENMSAYIAGPGFMDISNIEANTVIAQNFNNGDLSLHSNKSLLARIAGNGNIKYTGNPAVVYERMGKGKLIKIGH